jgi:hypothetical protein
MANEKFYICNINLSGRYGDFIPAGTPFIREDLVEHTFSKLTMQKHIQEYVSSIVTTSIGKGVPLVSIPSTTPDAAVFPPIVSEKEKKAARKKATLLKKEKAKAKAVKKAAKADAAATKAAEVVAEEEEAQAKLTEAELDAPVVSAVNAKPESTVEQIWTCDPKRIKDMSFENLLSQYRSQCVLYGIVPEKFETKKLLIAKLSSEYKK